MLKKSRFVVAFALVMALGASAIAYGQAGQAATSEAAVDGQITPTKLDKKKYKPIDLFSGVRTTHSGRRNRCPVEPSLGVPVVPEEHQVRL